MTANGAKATSNGLQPEEPQPLPPEVLADPKIREQIAEAQAAAREGRTRRGKSADDLLDLANEQRRVGTRPSI